MKLKNRMSLSVIMAAMSFSGQAAEYSVTPFASSRLDAETNKRLVESAGTNFGIDLTAGALFSASTDSSSLSLTPTVSVRRFTDDDTGIDQDTEDYSVDANANHRFNERFSAGAYFNYSNAGVVNSELDDLGITFGGDDVASTGFALPNENFSVETISFGPSVTYTLSEKDSLTFGGGYSEAEYENQNTLLSDYTDYSYDISWSRQLSDRNQLVVSIYTSNLDPELNTLELGSIADGRSFANDDATPISILNHETDEDGVTIGYIRAFSDTLTGNFTIGYRKSEGEFPDLTDFDIRLTQASADTFNGGVTLIDRLDPRLTDPTFLNNPANQTFLRNSTLANHRYKQGIVDNKGLLLDFSLDYEYDDRTQLTAGLSRASLPSGRGLIERDEFRLGGIYEYSDRITTRGDFIFFTTKTLSEETLVIGNQESDQIRLEAAVDYRITEFWTLGGGYTFRSLSREGSDASNGHGIFVSIGYNGNIYAISR